MTARAPSAAIRAADRPGFVAVTGMMHVLPTNPRALGRLRHGGGADDDAGRDAGDAGRDEAPDDEADAGHEHAAEHSVLAGGVDREHAVQHADRRDHRVAAELRPDTSAVFIMTVSAESAMT